MISRIFIGKLSLLLSGLALLFATLACATLSQPAATPRPERTATALPDFALTADYQSALATQLAATQAAILDQQRAEIKPTLQAIYADQCVFPPVQAADGSFLRGLNIDLWPEYDRPSMLVMYQILLWDTQPLPVSLSFRIPARAGEPNAVALQDSSGMLFNTEYTRNVDGDWATIAFTATTQSARLEYYDPGLTSSGFSRHFDFQWTSDYSISSLVIRIRPTPKVTSMQTTPQMGGPGLASDGSLFFCSRTGPLEVNTPVSYSIDYEVNSGP